MSSERADLYTRITSRIIASLEQGVRPWLKPWNAEHAAGRITRPLRHNGEPYRGINVLSLWGEAEDRGYTCPIWMTYKQAQELNAQVRKGERGSLVVYADRFHKTEIGENGEDIEREIPFLKGYTVFNYEQIDGLPARYTAPAAPVCDPAQRGSPTPKHSSAIRTPTSGMAAVVPTTISRKTSCRCRRSRPSRTPKATTPRYRTR